MPPPPSDLYAWARPAHGLPGDHTFVTDYDEPFVGKPPSRSWYCAGGVYSSDEPSVRPLLRVEADIELAEYICEPDNPGRSITDLRPTAGMIYGFHGVCHQIANRILYSTHSPDVAPLVDQAEGYRFSSVWAGYGNYGTNELIWRASLNRYSPK